MMWNQHLPGRKAVAYLTTPLFPCWNLKASNSNCSLSLWDWGRKWELDPVSWLSNIHLYTTQNSHIKLTFRRARLKHTSNNKHIFGLQSTVNWPIISQECVSRDSVHVWDHSCHTAVYSYSERDVVKLFNWSFKLHHVSQKKLSTWTRELPVIWKVQHKKKRTYAIRGPEKLL